MVQLVLQSAEICYANGMDVGTKRSDTERQAANERAADVVVSSRAARSVQSRKLTEMSSQETSDSSPMYIYLLSISYNSWFVVAF